MESFKNATGLRWINLDNNRIRKVDQRVLEKLPSLVFLYMEKNQLEEVPAALPRNLEQLRLSQNQISRIPPGVFSKLENLLLLDLQHNKLSDGVFKPDTFQGLKNLMQLNLAHNTLRKMPPKMPSAIHQLYLDSNRIEAIPSGYFKGFPNLAFIRLNYNQLSDRGLPKNSFNISNLLVLHLSHNRISSVPAISSRLEHLYLNNNSIESECGDWGGAGGRLALPPQRFRAGLRPVPEDAEAPSLAQSSNLGLSTCSPHDLQRISDLSGKSPHL